MQAVTIVDVFARDGLQTVIHEQHLHTPTTEEKIAFIQQIDAVGVPEIEITGFVHPRVIPSLADADEVAIAINALPLHAVTRALVPNMRGAERALKTGMRKISCLIIASETYQQLNSNMSVERNVQEIQQIAKYAQSANISVAVGMGTVFICPYQGVIPKDHILRLIDSFINAGIYEISLADSVGLAWPTLVRDRIKSILSRWPDLKIGLHLHTLAGLALTNAYVAYEEGVRIFEGSVGGIGGGIAMPVHTTNMGNVATEDLVYMFESCGISTGIDQLALAAIGQQAQTSIGTGNGFVTTYGTLDALLQTNRLRLGDLQAAPPGDSRKH